jgi:histidine ammonia-lyase
MTVTIDDRRSVNVDALRRVAFEGAGVVLSESAKTRIAAAHEALKRYVERHHDSFIYGVTSGWGPEAHRRSTLEQARARSARGNPFGTLSFGGEPLPESLSRACVLADFAMIVDGNTGMHVGQAEAIGALLEQPLPQFPSRGITAAGEILPRMILFERLPARAEWGLSVGSGNGAAVAAAMAGFAAVLGARRLSLAERVLALSTEAFNAPLEAYDLALAPLWGDPHETRALEVLNGLLSGGTPRAGRRPYQAPVSYRILPRVLGAAGRSVARLREVADGALATAVANPTFLPPSERYPDGRVLSTGGFHAGTTAPALDAVAAAWTDLAGLAHRHAIKLHKGEVSLLPDRLWDPDAVEGQRYSTTYLEYVANDFHEEMRRLAAPTLLSGGEVAASGQDDIAAPTPLAFTTERRIAELLDGVLAILAVVASQALFVTRRPAPPALEPLLEFVRDRCPPVQSKRRLGDDTGLVATGFSEAVADGAIWLTQEPWVSGPTPARTA